MNAVNSREPRVRDADSVAKRRRMQWIAVAAAAAVTAVALVSYRMHRAGAQDGGAGSGRQRAVPVGVATAYTGNIDVYQDGLGTVVPRNVVTVHTRVDGELMQILFKEGQLVKKGELLAQIDPRPFQVVLTQADGQMARDQALAKNAEIDLARYRTLYAQDSISRQQLDTQAALVRQYDGNLLADKGQVDSAKLSLVYTRITAPLAGRVGLRQVDPGNIVHASDAGGLVVITQIQPMTVVFAVPETRLAQIVPRLYAGAKLPVEAWDRDDKIKLATGTLIAADNQIDTTTGTVKLRAVFQNEKYLLFPNEFVNARVLVERRRGATLIPAAAVQIGATGPFVYVVLSNHTVAVRPVALGPAEADLAAVDKGVAPGDIVVVDGTDRLRNGAPVLPVARDSPAARRPRSGNDQPSDG